MFGITERGDAGLDLSWQSFTGPKILITKAPQNLLGLDLEKCIVHCSITGLGGSDVEPNVTPADETLEAYQSLVDQFGGERIVLRVDPIFPFEPYLEVHKMILAEAKGRIRVSFLDAYKHTRERLGREGLSVPWQGLHAPLDLRRTLYLDLQRENEHEIEVCGEPGFPCTGCLSARDFEALGLEIPGSTAGGFQRKACCCLAEKRELLSNKTQCPHGCLYCYWKN